MPSALVSAGAGSTVAAPQDGDLAGTRVQQLSAEGPTAEAAARSEPIAADPNDMRATDPILDQLVDEADSLRPDFGRVHDYCYYDYAREISLSAELRKVVNDLVLERDYDGRPGNAVVDARTAHLSPDDAESVGRSASMVWQDTIGKALDRTTKKLVTHLAEDPDFDPLPWKEDIDDFVASRLAGERPALVAGVQRELNHYAFESGLIAKVEEEMKRDARAALDAMPPLDRDNYGFTTRNAKRLQLAAPYISDVSERRRRFVIYWMSRIDGEEGGPEREARYATAIRALAGRGQTRTAISRTLGISTSVMDRIERENRHNVALAADDPILTDLAPALR